MQKKWNPDLNPILMNFRNIFIEIIMILAKRIFVFLDYKKKNRPDR
jgi:hypothetical protein